MSHLFSGAFYFSSSRASISASLSRFHGARLAFGFGTVSEEDLFSGFRLVEGIDGIRSAGTSPPDQGGSGYRALCDRK